MPEIRSLILDGRTWAEVSLAALGENFHAIQKHVGNGVTICGVVKADGYGHGAVECARALESEGAEWLGVTDAAEGLALRGAGAKARILLMTGIWKGEEDGIVAQNLTPTIWEPWHIEALERAARKRHGDLPSHRLPVHLKLDTGMNRLGASKEALPHLCEMLSGCRHLTLEGVSTHFASAEVLDADDAVQQMKRFEEGLAVLRNYGLRPPLIHMGNSAAMSARPETWKTMVRPGIALYGYSLAFTRGGEPAAVADLTIVDVSHIRGVAVGDEVVLIGQGGGKSVDAVELARLCESVPYEILCGLSQRVPRVYC